MTPERFQVLRSYDREPKVIGCPRDVPWALLAPHEAQALRNHGQQTLAVLNSRGGLGPCEMVAVLEDRRWHQMDQQVAVDRLNQLVAAFEAGRAVASDHDSDLAC